MDISLRLKAVLNFADKCNCIADIGTDHGYIPIMLTENNICNKAIASDINKGPLKRAENNIKLHKLENRIECRIGSGISVLKKNEAEGCIICGMGGHLISDIIDDGKAVFCEFDFAVLQPTQHADYLRKYLITNGYFIADEDLCFEDGKYYQIIKIKKNINKNRFDYAEGIYFEVSKILIEKKHPLVKNFIEDKIRRYKIIKEKIYAQGCINSENKSDKLVTKTQERKNEVVKKIYALEELLKCI